MFRVDCAFHLENLVKMYRWVERGMFIYFDIWEICLDHTIHDPPNMCNWIFMLNTNFKLFSDKGSRTFTTKEVPRPYSFFVSPVNMLQIYFHGILRVRLFISSKSFDCPRSLDFQTILFQICDEGSLYQALMKQCRKWISRVA